MNTRPTLDERMDLWLNLRADQAEIPDAERQRFIDWMRGTNAYAATRLGMTASDLRDDLGLSLVRWLTRLRGRRRA